MTQLQTDQLYFTPDRQSRRQYAPIVDAEEPPALAHSSSLIPDSEIQSRYAPMTPELSQELDRRAAQAELGEFSDYLAEAEQQLQPQTSTPAHVAGQIGAGVVEIGASVSEGLAALFPWDTGMGEFYFTRMDEQAKERPLDPANPKEAVKIAYNEAQRIKEENQDTDLEDMLLFRLGARMRKFSDDTFPDNPQLADSFWYTSVPRGVGSVGGFILANLATGGSAAGTALVAGLAGSGEQIQDAIAKGASEEQKLEAASWGFLPGILDALPVLRVLGRFDKASGGKLSSRLGAWGLEAILGALEEGTQEAAQELVSNTIAKQIYDKERGLWSGVLKAGEAGGVVGLIVNLLSLALGKGLHLRKRRKEIAPVEPIAPPAPAAQEEIAEPEQQQQAPVPLSKEHAEVIAATDPELAARILELPPNRKAFEKEFPDLQSTRQQRTDFKDWVKEAIENAPELPPAPIPEVQQAEPVPVPQPVATPAQLARAELGSALDELGNYLQGRTFANPLSDPRVIKLVGKVVAKAVKAGVTTFAEVVHQVANTIGSAMTRIVAPLIEEEWNKARKDNKQLDKPTDVAAILEERRGRPELANPAAAPQARELVRDVDEARKAAGIPVTRSAASVQQEAEARLATNRDGERQRLMNMSRRGSDMNDVDVVVAKSIVNQEALAAVQSLDVGAIRDAMGLINSYRVARAETGRALRQGRDPVETPAQRHQRIVTEALLTPPTKTRRKLDKAKHEGNTDELNRLLDEYAKQIADLKARLKALGVDLDSPEPIFQDPVTSVRAVQTIAAANASYWDKQFEYWRNAILSAPPTQLVNAIGNAVHIGWYFTAEKLVSALARTAGLNPTGARWGEFKQALGALLPSLAKASKNFWMTWDAEMPMFHGEIEAFGPMKIEEANVAIQGELGRKIRIPQRTLGAVDAYQKTIAAYMEVASIAYRLAADAGLDPKSDEFRAFMAAQVADHTSEAWLRAVNTANRLTFLDRSGRAIPLALYARANFTGLRYLMPFVTTPMNIFKLGARKSPLGIIPLAYKIHKARTTGDWSGIDVRVAEQIIAWSLLLALLYSNDEDDPWITGAAPYVDRGKRETAYRTGQQPQSIIVGGHSISYSRLEPFATTLALTVDTANAINSGDPWRVPTDVWTSILQQAKDKTFMRGIGDLLRMTEPGESGTNMAKFLSNFAASWIPNILRQNGRSLNEEIPERSVWGDKSGALSEWLTRLLRRTVQRTELGLIKDQPKVDLWGRRVKQPGSPVPNTDWLYRMIIPFRQVDVDILAPDRVILNWNNAHPEQPKNPLPPSKRYTIKGESYSMTDEQYEVFSERSGKRAYEKVMRKLTAREDLVANPTERLMDQITDIIGDARERERKALIRSIRDGTPYAVD